MAKALTWKKRVLRAIKWLDRKGVTLLTGSDSAYSIKTTQRYDRVIGTP